jgi:hypothetical protein
VPRIDLEGLVEALEGLGVTAQVVKAGSFIIPCINVPRIDLERLVEAAYRLLVAA